MLGTATLALWVLGSILNSLRACAQHLRLHKLF